MTTLSSRPIVVYDLPLPKGIDLLHPEQVVLRYFKSHTIDVGALCYLRRNNFGRRTPGEGRKVDLTSFCSKRSRQIRTLIDVFTEAFGNGRQNAQTLDLLHRHFVQFMDWCDTNQHNDVLNDELLARAALRAYVEYLRRLVAQNQLNNNTAVNYQNHSREVLEAFFNVEYLDRGINILSKNIVFETPTAVPSDDAQGKVIAWCQSLFYGISELVIDQKPYPFAMNVPNYLNWPDNRLWIFPCHQWCKPPGSTYKRKKGPLDLIAYDFENGGVFELKTLESQYKAICNPKRAQRLRTTAIRKIRVANNDFRCRWRIERGILAIKAFLILFIADTGMNPSQAISLPWSNELDDALGNPLIERQGFRSIKYRANNKSVSFEIGAKFMPHFRRFLQLRQYLLNGKQFESLFFGYKPSDLNNPVARFTDIIGNTFDAITRLDPTLPKVMPIEWRAAKQDHMIRNHDPYTAARAMQHSVTTALRKYSNGSESVHQMEIGNFLSHVESVVIENGKEIEHGETRALGVCSSPNHPVPINDKVPVQPDCKGPEGCLFCDQFRVHADDQDTRKLLSCRYCIQKTSHLANSQEQFERVFGVVLNRIDFILGEVKRKDAGMVEKVEREVDIDGDLDPYWVIKLETLMELDLI